MRVPEGLRRFVARLSGLGAALLREPEFNCGDCERSDRCGRPPSKSCIVRAAQLERGDWRFRRRAAALDQW